ncbi:Metallo-hydrolase/oxidoreductase [Artomyces pyxidatus]|uniref:Metallo-hydrolase/oxidoreductase n=1 Tax=Artomyces pyxidatus TaxID=48021 RepID=A0ACB8SK20_9AGAM|nr:Metallo-hydrolase/oxidoreductase [Artomyces pyxidatus]
MSLPPPGPNQAYCEVSALDGGQFALPLHFFIDPPPPGPATSSPAPSLCWYIRHASDPQKHLVFDLGLRRSFERYPPAVRAFAGMCPLSVDSEFPVRDTLARGGVRAEDVTTVCLSHVHWDHVGEAALFPNATFWVGAGARPLVEGGYPAAADAVIAQDYVPLAPGRAAWLDPAAAGWAPLGPFPRAWDAWGDGSLYVVDTPGHVAGHLALAVRTSARGDWVVLSGDCAHDRRLISGEAQIAVVRDEHGQVMFCGHEDLGHAKETIEWLRRVGDEGQGRVKVILQHDVEWWEANGRGEGGAFWPGKITYA